MPPNLASDINPMVGQDQLLQEQKQQQQQQQQSLPSGFIDQFLQHLKAAPGSNDISLHLLQSLHKLSSKVQLVKQDEGKNPSQDVAPDEGSSPIPQLLSSDVTITSLQDFIFSNITNIDYIPTSLDPVLQDEGYLTGLEEVELCINRSEPHESLQNHDKLGVEYKDDFQSMNTFLSKTSNLKSLSITVKLHGKHPDLWNPFESIKKQITLQSLESLVLNIPSSNGNFDDMGIIQTLFKYYSFPSLKSILLPAHFLLSTDRDFIKALLNSLDAMPSLTSFLKYDRFEGLSQQFVDELIQSPFLSKIQKLCFSSNVPQSHSHPLLSSPKLTGLKDLNLRSVFSPDCDKVSEWLFKMEWMANITTLALPCCSQATALAIATSPLLVNLTRLDLFQDRSQTNTIILQSTNLGKLKKLVFTDLTSNEMEVVATSPHLGQIEELIYRMAPKNFFSSISSSTTLKNIKEFNLFSILEDDEINPSDLISFFQSPNIQHAKRFSLFYGATMPFDVVKSVCLSEYMTNHTKFKIYRRFRTDPFAKSPKTSLSEWIHLLSSNPAWSNLTHLEFSDANLIDDDIKALVESPYITQLTSLNLCENPCIRDQGLIYLAQSSNLSHLKSLYLFHPQDDPEDPPQFSGQGLIQFFKSHYINSFENLELRWDHDHEDAIRYLIKHPDIFSNNGSLYDKSPKCTWYFSTESGPRPSAHVMHNLIQLARQSPFTLSFCDIETDDLWEDGIPYHDYDEDF